MGAGVRFVYHSPTDFWGVTIATFQAEEDRALNVFHGGNRVSEGYGFGRPIVVIFEADI